MVVGPNESRSWALGIDEWPDPPSESERKAHLLVQGRVLGARIHCPAWVRKVKVLPGCYHGVGVWCYSQEEGSWN